MRGGYGRIVSRTRRSSDRLSRLAARVMRGYSPTKAEIRSLAASVLAQDERRGLRAKKRRRKAA